MTRTLNALRTCPLLRPERHGTLRCLGRQAEEFDVAEGRLLLVEGDPSNDLYLVLEGAVVVHAHHRPLAYLPAGQLVGEIGVITGRPRSASVETIAPSRLLRISGGQFRSAFQASSTLRGQTRGLLASRGTEATKAPGRLTAGIVPTTPSDWTSLTPERAR
jgi:CRP-like cAMP-binding protein